MGFRKNAEEHFIDEMLLQNAEMGRCRGKARPCPYTYTCVLQPRISEKQKEDNLSAILLLEYTNEPIGYFFFTIRLSTSSSVFPLVSGIILMMNTAERIPMMP